MKNNFPIQTAGLSASALLCIALASCTASNSPTPGATTSFEHENTQTVNNLPQADPVFHGKIGQTYHDSTADKGMFASPSAPKGAPNILLV